LKYSSITKTQSKDTSLAFILIFTILTLYKKELLFVYPAVAFSLISMTFPQVFKPLAYLWFGIAELMGALMSKIILSMVFFFIITPLTLLIKMMGVDSMRIKEWHNGKDTAFIDRNHQFTKSDIEKPY
jgi:hypothetical protein